MKHNVMSTVASLRSLLFTIIHLTHDVMRQAESIPGTPNVRRAMRAMGAMCRSQSASRKAFCRAVSPRVSRVLASCSSFPCDIR